jgi:predicted dehydrogenase
MSLGGPNGAEPNGAEPAGTEKLRVGIVGCGSIARSHARAYAAHPRVEMVGVHDLVPAHAQAYADEFGTTAYGSIEQLAAQQPQLVSVATPPGSHTAVTGALLEVGCSVLLEKPPTINLADLDTLAAAQAASAGSVYVVFQHRHGSGARRAHDLLTSGALGRPQLAVCETLWYRPDSYFAPDWRGNWAGEGGGPTLGHGIHQLDLLAFLLGDWESVQGRLWRLDRETQTEDASTATIVFADGVIAQVVTSAVSPRETSSIRIDTQKATITVDHLYGHGHENWAITPAPGFEEEAAGWALPEFEERSDHAPLLRDVFEALLSGAPLPPTADAPARSFEIVAAIYASAAAGGAAVTPQDLAQHPTHRAGFASPVIDKRDLSR